VATKPPIETAIILKKTDPKKAAIILKNYRTSGKISPGNPKNIYVQVEIEVNRPKPICRCRREKITNAIMKTALPQTRSAHFLAPLNANGVTITPI
jgi:hypothetical protein